MLTDGCRTRFSECQSDRLAKHMGAQARKWGKHAGTGRKTKVLKEAGDKVRESD